MLYEQIARDAYILDVYRRTAAYEDAQAAWAYHDIRHVQNVAATVEALLTPLHYDAEFIEEAKIAALLHDLGAVEGKSGHGERSYTMAREYFRKNNITLRHEAEVLRAIRDHSDGFDSPEMMTLALILGDKLDILPPRLTKAGLEVIGQRQMRHIEEITVSIDEARLTVSFAADEAADLAELDQYYFITKVFRAIESFAAAIRKEPQVLFRGEPWVHGAAGPEGA